MVSTLSSAVDFLKDFGLFDVVLPFLLIFAIVFALLEKTRVLGTEEVDGKALPRRSINTLVSFAMALLVVAADQVVSTINEAIPHVALILVGLVSFMLLVGSLYKEGEFDLKKHHKPWILGFMGAILVVVLLIFASALKTSGGESWLEWGFNQIASAGSGGGTVGATIIFVVIAVLAIVYATRTPKDPKPNAGAAEGDDADRP
jgi:hypothetical protein